VRKKENGKEVERGERKGERRKKKKIAARSYSTLRKLKS